jgi:hypothetical protein
MVDFLGDSDTGVICESFEKKMQNGGAHAQFKYICGDAVLLVGILATNIV